MKSLLHKINPSHQQGLSNKQYPNFPFFFWFRFLMKTLLNPILHHKVQSLLQNHLGAHLPTHQGFSKRPKATIRGCCCGLRDLNVTNKANKLPSLIYGYIIIRCLFKHSYLPRNLTNQCPLKPSYIHLHFP